jgi:hypothetical protein
MIEVMVSSRRGCSMARVCTKRVAGQVDDQVRGGAGLAHPPVEPRGQPHVPVVEADHEEPGRGEALAPLDPVVDALAAQAVDQQKGRIGLETERLEVQLDLTVQGVGHGSGS